jgi:hypothetical protein
MHSAVHSSVSRVSPALDLPDFNTPSPHASMHQTPSSVPSIPPPPILLHKTSSFFTKIRPRLVHRFIGINESTDHVDYDDVY